MHPVQHGSLLRLYLVREMLRESLQLSTSALPTARMRVVLTLDHAVELTATTLLEPLDIHVPQHWYIPKMLEALAGKVPSLAPHRAGMERLHGHRDHVQHQGIVPSPEDIRLFMAQADSFIRDAVAEVLKRDLDEFSPIELVSDEAAKARLQSAREAIAAGDYRTALRDAAVGFALGSFIWRSQNRGPSSRSGYLARRVADAIGGAASAAAGGGPFAMPDRDRLSQFAQQFGTNLALSGAFAHALQDLLEPVEMARFGVDVQQYSKFHAATPYVGTGWTQKGVEVWVDEDELARLPATEADALAALDFACWAVVQLEGKEP